MLSCGRYLSSVATPSLSPLRTLTFFLLRRPTPRFLSSASASVAAAAATAVETETKAGAGGGGDGGAARPQWKAAIDFKWIRDNRDTVATNIRDRNSVGNLDPVLQLYDQYLALQKEVERIRAERNAVANKMKGKLDPSVRQALVEEGKSLKEEDLVQLTDKLQLEAQSIPNAKHPDVPIGGEESSVVRKEEW